MARVERLPTPARALDGVRRRARLAWVLLLPPNLVLAVFFAFPLGLVGIYSFWTYVPGRITNREWTVANFARFAADPFYRGILLDTLMLGLLVTAGSLVLALPVGYYLARQSGRAKALLTYLIIAPMMVGVVVRSFGWLILLGSAGFLNSSLLMVGLIDAPLRLLYTRTAVVLGLIEVLLPFMVLPLMAAIERIPVAVEEAARCLGANGWTVFRKITLPQALPGVVSGSVLVFAGAVTAYATPALLGGPSVKVMSSLIYQQMLVSLNWPFGAAQGLILMVMSTGLVLAYLLGLQPRLERGER